MYHFINPILDIFTFTLCVTKTLLCNIYMHNMD